MKTVIMLSALSIWSLAGKKGAPSYYNTIIGYVRNGWKVYLIGPYNEKDQIEGVTIVTAGFSKKTDVADGKIRKFCKNVSFSKKMEKELYRKGSELVEKLSAKGIKPLVYAYEVHAVIPSKKISIKYNLKLITRFQGTIMSFHKNRFIEHVAYYPHYQALHMKSDLIVMTNDGSYGEEYLRRIGNSTKTLFLRNGVDIKKSDGKRRKEIQKKLGLKDDDFVLITVSRLANWKRVDRAVDAVAKCKNHIKEIKLVIVGDGGERKNLEKQANSLGISDLVIFAGAVNQEDVPDYLEVADVFLSLYDLANVGNPSFEAMKNGKAVVTINNGDTSSLFENDKTALMAEPDNLGQIPELICKLYDEPVLRGRLGSNAEIYANENFWTWDERMNFECKEAEKLIYG